MLLMEAAVLAVAEAVACHRRIVVQANLLVEALVARTAQAVTVEVVMAAMILVAVSTVVVHSAHMVDSGILGPGAYGADSAVHPVMILLMGTATTAVKMRTTGANVLCMKTRAMV